MRNKASRSLTNSLFITLSLTHSPFLPYTRDGDFKSPLSELGNNPPLQPLTAGNAIRPGTAPPAHDIDERGHGRPLPRDSQYSVDVIAGYAVRAFRE